MNRIVIKKPSIIIFTVVSWLESTGQVMTDVTATERGFKTNVESRFRFAYITTTTALIKKRVVYTGETITR